MEYLQQKRSSSPDITETSSSLYLREAYLRDASNSSASTHSLERNEQEDIVVYNPNDVGMTNILQTAKSTFEFRQPEEANIPSTNAEDRASLPSSNLYKKNSILRRSLPFLNRSEEKKTEPQLVKVHTYTIYDEEKDKFIEVTEEEWDGDGPPSKRSTDPQKESPFLIDKALPSLPEPKSENVKENPITKFNRWLKDNHPYINKYKIPIFICLMILLIILLIIIILAATGVFAGSKDSNNDNGQDKIPPEKGKAPSGKGKGSTDKGKPGLQMNGTGDGTYYDPGVGLGACGQLYTSDDFVCAMNAEQYGTAANPNDSPICNMCIRVTGPKGTVEVKIVDKCPPCKYGDVDLSPAAFDVIGNRDDGRIHISWEGC